VPGDDKDEARAIAGIDKFKKGDPMPKSIARAMRLGMERHAMAETCIRLIEAIRDDYMPGVRTWDALALLIILRKMFDLHTTGRTASASALSRAVGMPRTTMLRKLAQLKKIGAVEQHGLRYAMSPTYLNSPTMLWGFGRRAALVRRTAKKLSNLDISVSSQH